MKLLWTCFIVVSMLATLLVSAVSASNNEYDKATYFLVLAIFNYSSLK